MEAMAIFSEGANKRARAVCLLCLAVAGIAAACAPKDAGLGASVRHNMALHVVDPAPHHKGEPLEGASGARAASAQERYRTGAVAQPSTIQTTSRPASGARGGGQR